MNALVKQVTLSRPSATSRCRFSSIGGTRDLQKPCSGEVWWAREELNLRPLPCQLQRATAGLYVGRLETGKDEPPWEVAPILVRLVIDDTGRW
jgi:hypothetical protein